MIILQSTRLYIKRIIQILYQKKSLQNIEFLKRNNPGYSYKLWLDEEIEDFIKREYGDEILKYYLKLNPQYGAARADLFRYLLIYRCGGVYLDLKSSIHKPLDEVLYPEDYMILSHWDNRVGEPHEGYAISQNKDLLEYLPRGEYVQWFIIAKAGAPWLYNVILSVLQNIDNYNPFVDKVAAPAVLRMTGPIAYSYAIINTPQKEKIRYIELKEFGLVYSIYESNQSNAFAHKPLYNEKKKSYNDLNTPLILSRYPFMNKLCEILFTLWGKISSRVQKKD